MTIVKAVAILDHIRKKKKVTSKELAEKFEVSVRTVLRYVYELALYFPVYTERGTNGGIRWLGDEKERKSEDQTRQD